MRGLYPPAVGTGNLVSVTRADRRLVGRLTLALAAAVGLGVPVLLLALLVRAKWDPLLDLDLAVTNRLHSVALRQHWLVDAMQGVSVVIGPWVLRPVVTVVGLVLLARRRIRLGSWVLVTNWGGALLGVVLKELVDRARPDLLDAVATAGGRSFPSGHALGGTISCGLLALVLGGALPAWRKPIWAVAAAAVVLVCFARVFLGVHFLSDVTAGVLLGIAWLALTAAAFQAWRRDVGLPPASPAEAAPEVGDGVPEPR
jgi:membrane-associated phospholipid phosphatase